MTRLKYLQCTLDNGLDSSVFLNFLVGNSIFQGILLALSLTFWIVPLITDSPNNPKSYL